MPDFIYGDCAYFNAINKIPKMYHQLFIHREEPGMTITSSPKTFEVEINTVYYNVFQ